MFSKDMACPSIRQLHQNRAKCLQLHLSPSSWVNVPCSLPFKTKYGCSQFLGPVELSGHRNLTPLSKASSSSGNSGSSPVDDYDEEDGVSLGTMKLPLDTDLPRFETLLFQWANSLCQGATLPLPVPLKVDKIQGGARLGFITIGDGKTEVLVHIDCLVYPTTDGSAPIFKAIRNGPLKDQPPPGEPRIMRSLLEALKKSVEIARF